MSAITVEVDLSQPLPQRYVGSDEDGPMYQDMTVQEAIIQVAADKLFDACQKDVRKQVQDAVTERVNEEVDARLGEYVAAAFMAPLQVTDRWGDPIKGVGSMKDLIIKHIQDQLTVREGGSFGDSRSVLSKVLKDFVSRQLEHDMADEVKKARDQILTALSAKASEVMAATIVEGLKRR